MWTNLTDIMLSKRSRHKCQYIVRLYTKFKNIQNQPLVIKVRIVVTIVRVSVGEGKGISTQKLYDGAFWTVEVFCTLIWMMVTGYMNIFPLICTLKICVFYTLCCVYFRLIKRIINNEIILLFSF